MTTTRQNRLPIRWLLPLVMIVSVIMLGLHHQRNGIPDDGFITYRYVANLIEGRGFVYNAGDAVLGTTTPGYGLLLAAASTPFDAAAVPVVARIVNLILTIGVIGMGIAIARRAYPSALLLWMVLPLIILTEPKTMYGMISGMEPVLFLVLSASVLLALLYQRSWIAAGAAGLLLWVRPEGVFVMGLVALTLMIRWRRQTLSFRELIAAGGVMVLPALAYVGMLVVGYGTLVPQSVASKLTGLYNLTPLSVIGRILDALLEFWYGYLSVVTGGAVTLADVPVTVLALLLVLTVTLFIIGSRTLYAKEPLLILLPAYVMLLVIFYGTRDTYLFRWYFALIGLPLTLVLWAGIHRVVMLLVPRRRRQLAGWIATGFVLLGGLLNHPWLDYVRVDTHPAYVTDREAYYYDFAERIRDDLPPAGNSKLAMPEIGVLGFYLRDYDILDTAGLVSPEALPYFPPPPTDQFGGIDGDLIRNEQPDTILTFDIFVQYTDGDLPASAERPLSEQAWFSDTYEILYREDVQLSYFNRDELEMRVYARR